MTAAATPPERLGRYRIVRPLARGGMAELFLARASGIQGFEKLVVVKRVLPELARDADYVSMFLDEARLAARLHHSNLVQVYDIGEADGLPFYAMEYLDGHDVREIMRALQAQKERLPLEHALLIVIGVAAALHYAHEMRDDEGRTLGVVHRDVSPQNVAVTFDGGVKLFDFGVAKAKRRATETRHGTLKGKLSYMSPEQCRGEEVDRRSDVFSVAILLWELLTGRRLYGGHSDFGVMKSIAESDAPRPSLVWPDCPAELEAIVMRGLRRERQARFATTEELQLALEAFARESRLAVSNVGLGRQLRALFAPRVAKAIDSERLTLYDLAAPEPADDSGATVVDGVLARGGLLAATAASGARPAAADEASGAPERQTRAVARRARRGRWPLAAGLLATAAMGGAALWRQQRVTAQRAAAQQQRAARAGLAPTTSPRPPAPSPTSAAAASAAPAAGGASAAPAAVGASAAPAAGGASAAPAAGGASAAPAAVAEPGRGAPAAPARAADSPARAVGHPATPAGGGPAHAAAVPSPDAPARAALRKRHAAHGKPPARPPATPPAKPAVDLDAPLPPR